MDNTGHKKISNKKKEQIELISNFFFSFMLTFFIIICLSLTVLKIFGFTLLNVRTGSMQPTLPVNTLVFVQKVDPKEIAEGDIITFVMNEEGIPATHRVIRTDTASRTFVTKGDANNTEDPPVIWDNLIGKVKFKIPGIGGLFEIVTSEKNRPVVITIIVCLVILMFGLELAAGYIKKKKTQMPENKK